VVLVFELKFVVSVLLFSGFGNFVQSVQCVLGLVYFDGIKLRMQR
jgi:hypothetical protein